MKLAIAAILLIAPLAIWAAPVPAFSIACTKVPVTVFETAVSPIRIDWDGKKLTVISQWGNGKLDKSESIALASKNLTEDSSSVSYAFVTGVFPSKSYTYHQTFTVRIGDNATELSRMFATIDPDGFVVSTSRFQYLECTVE